MNNGGYYILKGFRDAEGMDDTVPGLDIVKVAEGFGVSGETVEDPAYLQDALRRALGAGRPYLLNVIVEPVIPTLPS